MNNHPTKSKKSTRRKPNQPQRVRQPSLAEDYEYSSSRQVDPWRGQFVQLDWGYCV